MDGGAKEAGHARRPGDVARSGADPEDIRVRRQEGRGRREVLGLQRALQPGKTMLRISNLNYGRLNLFDVFFEIRSATSLPSTTPSSRRAPSSTSSTRCCCSASSSRAAWGEPWEETPAEAEGETSSESPTKKRCPIEKKSQESATDVSASKSGTAPLRRRSGRGKIFRPRPLHSSHCAAFECFVNRFGAVCVTHFAAGITVLRIGGGRRTCCTNKVNVSRVRKNRPTAPPSPSPPIKRKRTPR